DSKRRDHSLTLSGLSGTISDCWSAREALVDGKFAAVCDETTQRKVMSWDFSNTGQCRLYITRESIYFSQLSMAFKLNSPYYKNANRMISFYNQQQQQQLPSSVQKLVEGGLITHWLGEELSNATECLRPPPLQTDTSHHLHSHCKPSWICVLSVGRMDCGAFRVCIGTSDQSTFSL
ncbi:hypothetical protein Pcinc_034262, partial [Petrolisthes cinctipes]